MAERSINKVILLGRLGKDPETKFTPSGVAKSTFTLATSQSWKDKQSGEWKESTQWHNVVLWRSESLANYLTKGKQVYVEGRIENRSWEDKDGQKRYITEIVCDELILLGGGNSRSDDQPVSRPRGQSTQAEFVQSKWGGGVRVQPEQAPAAQQTSDFGGGIDESDCPF